MGVSSVFVKDEGEAPLLDFTETADDASRAVLNELGLTCEYLFFKKMQRDSWDGVKWDVLERV